MNDPYKILGVSSRATASEIKRAYRDLAKKYHPDVSGNADASRRMQEVNDAYNIVGDPIKRAEYDQMQQMRAAQPGQTPPARQAQDEHVSCSRCGKVDASLRVSTFTTVWSFIILSFYKGWAYILCARCRTIVSLRFNLQILLFGWWGIPWGPIFSVGALIKNSAGGHQPRENNAILLAIVGQNLINLGEYVEAEKALTASLRLKEDPVVIRLLQIAKSKSGYIRPEPVVKKLFRLEGHPVFYNALLVLIVCGSLALLTLAGSATAKKPVADTSASADATNPLPTITWWQKLQAKINLARGERWGLPIRIGDTHDHVYEVLGDPIPSTNPSVAPYTHLAKDSDQEKQFWPDKGLSVTFVGGTVSSIYAASDVANVIAKSPYKGDLFYGVHAGDNLATLYSHLGTPFKADPTWGYAWRFGNLEISEDILGRSFSDGDKSYAAGDAWGGITITDIRPELEAEEDAKREQDRVNLTGKALSAQEIYDIYKNRIYVVTCYDSRGNPTTLGTGFQFRDDLIVTNYHVVQDARKITVRAISGMDQPVETAVTSVSTQPNVPSTVTFLGNRDEDWAVLYVGGSKLKTLPPVQTKSSPSPGEAVTVIGNPEGLEGSLTTGVVSAVRADNWVQISAPISHGSSGSPVFDSTGRWLGLATLSVVDGQNLNFATPSETITGEVQKLTASKDTRFYSVITPLHLLTLDPVFSRMDMRGDKMGVMSSAEAQASIDDITNLLKEYQDPQDQDTLLSHLADIYTDSLHDNQSALTAANKRVQIEGDQFDVWEDQGKILANLGNQAEANKSFARSIELAQAQIAKELDKNQQDYNEQQYQGEDDSYRKSTQEALERENASTKQSDAYIALEIGRMYLMMGDNDNGRKWLNSAIAWDTNPFMSVRPEATRLLKIIDQAQAQPPAPAEAQPLAPSQ